MTSACRLTIALVLAAALAAAGCRGPKSTPEATMESFLSALGAQDIDSLIGMTTPESIKKGGGEEKVRATYNDITIGMQGLDYKILSLAKMGKTAQASVVLNYTWRVRGKNPEPVTDEYQAHYLFENGGKWYVQLPGTSRVQAY